MRKKILLTCFIAVLMISSLSAGNLWASVDTPTRGIQSIEGPNNEYTTSTENHGVHYASSGNVYTGATTEGDYTDTHDMDSNHWVFYSGTDEYNVSLVFNIPTDTYSINVRLMAVMNEEMDNRDVMLKTDSGSWTDIGDFPYGGEAEYWYNFTSEDTNNWQDNTIEIGLYADYFLPTTGLSWMYCAVETWSVFSALTITDTEFYMTDNWLTFGVFTDEDAPFTVWDNGSEIGYSPSDGLYQVAKSQVTGIHYLTMTVNGSHSGADSSGQVYDTSYTSAGWAYFDFMYTVNPVQLSISELTFQQNNDTIIVSGWFLTPNTTLTWVLIEDSVETGTGTLVLSASGEYNSIRWTKTLTEVASNFTLTITADGSSVVINGYGFVIDSSSFVVGSFYQEGDTYYQVAPATDDMAWVVALVIVVVILIPVVIGLGFGMGKTQKSRPKRKDKSVDLTRRGI